MALHENRHDFVSKKHSRPGQGQTRASRVQDTRLEKRLQLGAVALPDIHAVAPPMASRSTPSASAAR